ncbi:MAG: nucleotidyl transferase AbiEii/AbiGii toxin family protein [Candidatus Berkelbacteria bacterium]|nr:nucleotidyl transferase AbiEii/AbiGii toxin family protein [Candidatus Berkelbacteria bacterium]
MQQTISKLQREILSQEQLRLLSVLENHFKDFILGGGTALAMQIKHRKSFDFDFFSPKAIPKNLLLKIKEIVPVDRVALDTNDELTIYSKNIKITILYYPFVEVFKNTATDKDLRYFPLSIIAAQKAYAIGRRGAYRDYYDLYSILNQKYLTLEEIIKNSEDIFAAVFNSKIFLEQLVYFDDLTDFEILPIDETHNITSQDTVKRFFESIVLEYVDNI